MLELHSPFSNAILVLVAQVFSKNSECEIPLQFPEDFISNNIQVMFRIYKI